MIGRGQQIAWWSLVVVLLAVGTLVAVWPEPPARALTANEGWTIVGDPGRLTVAQFPPTLSYLRRSVLASSSSTVFRRWTPDRGIQPFEAISPPFRAAPVMSVVVTGTTRTADGGHRAVLSCSAHPRRIDVFLGSVNVNAAEAIVRTPPGWCPRETRLHLIARGRDANVGVGAVFEISALSAWKSSFVGLLPYLALALLLPGALALTGAAVAARLAPTLPAPASALACLGLAALSAFLAYALVPTRVAGLLPLAAAAAVLAGLWTAGRDVVARTAAALRPHAAAWIVASVTFLALLSAADNGLGHWAPNYRFWPARWSSDNELPWLLAEGVRAHADLAGLFGGEWKATDRPPLMAGAHLLVADTFGWVQARNDGNYLRGLAFDAAAIAFSALWVPVGLFLLQAMLGVSRRRAFAAVLVVALLPFSIFNTVYGWPKAFGAAFDLTALVMAALAAGSGPGPRLRASLVAFGVLAGLGGLAHGSGLLFVLPVAVWLVIATFRKDPSGLALGASAGAALLLVWVLYQRAVLPSHDPLTKFALTGDFGAADPGKSLLAMLVERYSTLTLAQWLAIKERMFLQPLLPLETPLHRLSVNPGFGADLLGSLRAWDQMLLSGGNVLILVAASVVLGARAWHRHRPTGARPPSIDIAATRCAGIAVTVWTVLAAAFLAPIVLPHWPHATIFALACAGFGWTSVRRPRLFGALAGATLLYASLVWIFGPLREALAIDVVALTVFVLTAAGLAFAYLPGLTAGDPNAPA